MLEPGMCSGLPVSGGSEKDDTDGPREGDGMVTR